MCKFCESLKVTKRINRYNNKDKKFKFKYSVAMVTRTFVKGRYGCSGRTVDYRHLGCGYELNYCPECGVKLKT